MMALEGTPSDFAVGDTVRSVYEGIEFESVVHDITDLGYPAKPYFLLDIPGYDSPQWWYIDRCERGELADGGSAG